jgi:uncharacterized protein (DUF58 family)
MKTVWMRVKRSRNLVVLILLIGITFSYAMFQGGFVSWFLFYSFLPFGIYALAIVFYPLKDIKVARIFPKKEMSCGDHLEITISLTRKFPFPLFYLLVEDCLPDTLDYAGNSIEAKRIIYPIFRKKMSFTYQINRLKRGEHQFNTIRIKTGDPLGLIEKGHFSPVLKQILVYPAYEEMVFRPFQNQFDQGKAASRDRIQRDTTMATGIRDYQPGDRFSWINWKVSAKQNEVMVKEFEQRQSDVAVMLLDCTPDPHFELIVSFAASLLRLLIRRGVQVGVLDNRVLRFDFPIQGGEAQLHKLFYYLAKINDDSQVPLDRIVQLERSFFQKKMTIIMITANLSKSLIDKASFNNRQSGSVIIFLLKSENESANEFEKDLMAKAACRGVKVTLIHEHQFSNALLEVYRG